MISLHKSVVKQCKTLTSFSRQRGASTSMFSDDSLSTSGKRTTNGSLLDDSSSRRRNYGSTAAAASAATASAQEPCYSTFLYRNHPSTPVTVGWVNFEQQQPGLASPNSAAAAAAALARRNQASGGEARANPPRWARESNNVVNKDTFYGLPYKVNEPDQQANAAAAASSRQMHRAPIVAIEEDDDGLDCDDASVASSAAHSVEMDLPGVDGAEGMDAMNRNARRPKNANRGQRPVSRISRRLKKRSIGNHRR
jgi:hypothetical protein